MRRRCNCHKCCLSNYVKYTDDLMEKNCKNVMTVSECCNDNDSCGCDCGFDEEESVFPANPMLAQSYVPWQTMDKVFKPCIGLKMGTIFPELVSPYVPCQSIEEIEYIKKTNKIGEGCNKC